MIIECPSCAVKFNLPESALDAGPRKMKCSKCAFVWTARPPKVDVPEPVAAAVVAPRPTQRVPTKWTKSEYALAGASGVFVLIAVMLTVLHLAPQSFGFYGSFGLGFSEISLKTEQTQGGERFEPTESFAITGTITNNSVAPRHVPTLRVRAVTERGNVIYTKSIKGGNKVIPAGEAYTFNVEGLKRFDPEITRFMVEIGDGLELMLRTAAVEPNA
jgi:predicted Zn finger-like uncharacterized protein